MKKNDGRSNCNEVRSQRSNDGKGGQYEGRTFKNEGRFSLKGDVHKGSQLILKWKENEIEKRNNNNGVGHHEDEGDWIDGNERHGHNKLKFEKIKCLEKNIKEIVEKEKHL